METVAHFVEEGAVLVWQINGHLSSAGRMNRCFQILNSFKLTLVNNISKNYLYEHYNYLIYIFGFSIFVFL